MSEQHPKRTSDPDHVVTLRVPRQLLDRLDALIPLLEHEREFVFKTRVTRSDIIRFLLLQGIESYEPRDT